MKYKLCLFDFDYTLADTSKAIVECFRHTFKTMNLDGFDEEKAKKTIGMTLDIAFSELTEIKDDNQVKHLVEIYRVKSDEITIKNTVLFEDTIETLKTLRDKNIKIGIVSSRMGERIDKILEHLDCRQYIDYIIGYENVSTHKPNPEGLLKSLDYFNCKKEDVLYIGDSYIDAEAAQNGEIDFVGVTTGTTTQREFEKYNNVKIVNNLSSILELV